MHGKTEVSNVFIVCVWAWAYTQNTMYDVCFRFRVENRVL